MSCWTLDKENEPLPRLHTLICQKHKVIGSNTIHLGSSGKGDGESISVGDTLVDDKEGSDADAGSHGDSAPHHLES